MNNRAKSIEELNAKYERIAIEAEELRREFLVHAAKLQALAKDSRKKKKRKPALEVGDEVIVTDGKHLEMVATIIRITATQYVLKERGEEETFRKWKKNNMRIHVQFLSFKTVK